MDPFIEASVGLWGEFHHKLVGDIERELSARVPDHYSVRLNARSYVVVEEDPSKFHMRPDHRTRYGDDLDYSSRAGISLSPEEVAHLEAVLPTGKSRSEQS
jgi:hypothetical protein